MGKEEQEEMAVQLLNLTRELADTLWRISTIKKDIDELGQLLQNPTSQKVPTPDRFPNLQKFSNLEELFKILAKAKELEDRKREIEKTLGVIMTKPEPKNPAWE